MSDMPDKLTFADQVSIAWRLQDIARMIAMELSAATGGKLVPFSLYTWGGQRTLYVANCNREDVKAAMRETLERWDQDDGPVHQAN